MSVLKILGMMLLWALLLMSSVFLLLVFGN